MPELESSPFKPTLEELLKLATMGGIEAYQEMLAFQSGMERLQREAGHTQEEWDKIQQGILKLSTNNDDW